MTCGIGQRTNVRAPSTVNPAAASAITSGGSSLPDRPILQALPLSSMTPGALNLNANMLSAVTNLAAASASVSATPVALPSQLIPYPGIFTSPEEMKYFSMAQIQAVNQAHLAGEVAKLKPPFLTRNYMELAMLVCNTFRGKLFPCPHCRYVTDRRNNLKRHVATMHQTCDKQLECCGVSFSTKASLREHITIFHHNGYSCPFCGRRFCRKALLKRHLSVHSGQKDYTCPSCDYATSHKSNLERHKRIHARIQILEASSLEDKSRQGCKIFQESNETVRNISHAERYQRERAIINGLSSFGTAAETWTERGISVSSHPDEQEDCEIDIDDDDDDENSDVNVDACADDSTGFNIAAPCSNSLNIDPDASNIPINLVMASNSRVGASASLTARVTNGSLSFPGMSNHVCPLPHKQAEQIQ